MPGGGAHTSSELVLVGVNHRSSSGAVRDLICTDETEVPGVLARLSASGLSEFLWFSTCDRVEVLEQRLAHITTPMTVSVIGCVVNGPGEARETDIGFTGGGSNTHQVYIAGQPDHRLKDEDIVAHLVGLVEKKAAQIEAAKAEAEAAEAAE